MPEMLHDVCFGCVALLMLHDHLLVVVALCWALLFPFPISVSKQSVSRPLFCDGMGLRASVFPLKCKQ